MSIELKMSFKSVSELRSFLGKAEGVEANPNASVEVVPEVINAPSVSAEPVLTPAQKAKATKARKKAEKEAAAKKAAEEEAALNPPALPVETAASVMAAPAQVAPNVPQAVPVSAIDREAYCNHAKALIGRLQAAGLPDADIPTKLQEIFAQNNVAYAAISSLEDHPMVLVVSALNQFVEQYEATASQGVAANPSYI